MPPLGTALLRTLILAGGLLAAVILAVTGTWMWRGGAAGGLTAMERLLRHGTTTIHDFTLYPQRTLLPSDRPLPFRERTPGPAALPVIRREDGRSAPLPEALAGTRTLAFLVIRDDALVFEHYGPNHGPARPSQFFSVSKSVLATLVGMAIDDGLLRSLDQPVTDLVPELASQGFATVTLGHLVDMTSGLDYTENDNPFGLHVLMNYTSDLPRLILGFRRGEPAGARFQYKSGDTALLSFALQRALGPVSLTAYAQQRLWAPLGMEHSAVWSLDREQGMEKAWCCLAGTARDLAKLGRLYLARGVSGGRRLLTERWVDRAALRPSGDRNNASGYSFGWWQPAPTGSDLLAAGKDGQYLYVDPAHSAIIVRLGDGDGGLGTREWLAIFRTIAAHRW